MLKRDYGAIDRAVQSAPDGRDSLNSSSVLPYAGGALGGVIGAFAGNPLLGASLGYKAGGAIGGLMDGKPSADKTVDMILSAKRAREAAAEASALDQTAETINSFSPDDAGMFLGGGGD